MQPKNTKWLESIFLSCLFDGVFYIPILNQIHGAYVAQLVFTCIVKPKSERINCIMIRNKIRLFMW